MSDRCATGARPLPIDATIQRVGQRADLPLGLAVLIEILRGGQHAGQQEAGIDRRQLALAGACVRLSCRGSGSRTLCARSCRAPCPAGWSRRTAEARAFVRSHRRVSSIPARRRPDTPPARSRRPRYSPGRQAVFCPPPDHWQNWSRSGNTRKNDAAARPASFRRSQIESHATWACLIHRELDAR